MARVLIVEDSPTDLHVLREMLLRNGYDVSSAAAAEEGLRLAREEQPDLVLMDVVMPGMNGFQATRKLSRDPVTADIPVIIVTTKDQETDRVWGLRQGAREYITKPVHERELVTKIRAVTGA
jgi:twitching motility two-component system response regulator PilH